MKLKGQAKAKDLMEVVVKLAALVNRVHRMEGEVEGESEPSSGQTRLTLGCGVIGVDAKAAMNEMEREHGLLGTSVRALGDTRCT